MIAIVKQTNVESVSAHQAATRSGLDLVPRLVREAGQSAIESYLCFFASLRSKRTGYVYRAATKHFFRWAEDNGLSLSDIRAGHVNGFFSNTPWKESTVAFYFHSLKKLFGHLESDRVVDRSPFVNLPKPIRPAQEKKGKKLAKLKSFLLELDGYGENDTFYRPGLVAMYPFVLRGQDTHEIAKITGIPLPEVEAYAETLRKNGIWKDGKVCVSFDTSKPDWEMEAHVEMVLIIGCAAGMFERVDGNGEAV